MLIALIGCGELTVNTTPPPEGGDEAGNPSAESPPEEDGETGSPVGEVSTDLNHPTGNTAVILGTDWIVGTLSLIGIDAPRTATPNVQTAHSDAIVRSFGGKIYVVNRLGADNIQVVDPADDFAVPMQFSVGQGTNPHDIIVIPSSTETGPAKAFISLYQPEDSNSPEISTDDLLVANPETGEITGVIDLTPFTTDDGERLARASQMVLVEKRLFVAIQDLPSGFVGPDQPGKIVVVDTETETVSGTIELAGRNPISMDYSRETGLIYVALADYMDISSPYGGIEVVDPEQGLSRGILVDDLLLGGAPGDIETGGVNGCVTVGYFDDAFNFLTKVVSFGLNADEAPTLTTVYQSQGFINDIAVDQNGVLLVGDMDPSTNGTVFVDPVTGEKIDGPIVTGSGPYSITFVDR